MPTPTSALVAASGGDYTTLAAAEAGEQKDLVAADELLTITCNDDVNDTGGAIDWLGWTTDATRYVIIEAQTPAIPNGWQTDRYRFSPDVGATAWTNSGAHKLVVIGLQIENRSTGSSSGGVSTGNNTGTLFDSCYIRTGPGSNSIIAFNINNAQAKNCCIWQRATNAAGAAVRGNGSSSTLYNCTVMHAGGDGLEDFSGVPVAYNTVVWYDGGAVEAFEGTWGGDYNASWDATADGANSVLSIADPFVDSANGDFRLAASSAVEDQGDSISGAAPTVDMVGTSRPQGAAYDIGAFEVPGGASQEGSAADGIKLGDSVAPALNRKGTASDGLALGDAADPLLAYAPSVTDGILFGDTVAGSRGTAASASDGFVLGDTNAVDLEVHGSLSDGLRLGDAPTARQDAEQALTDGVKLGDTPQGQRDAPVAVSDGLLLGDAVDGEADYLRTVSDGIVLGDFAGAGQVAAVLDGLLLGDSVSRTFQARPSLSDGVKLGDTPAGAVAKDAAATDGLLLGDDSSAGIGPRALSDGVRLGDTVDADLDAEQSLSDGVKLGDSVAGSNDKPGAISDGLELGDDVEVQAAIAELIADSIRFGDTLTGRKATAAAATDGVILGDSPAGGRSFDDSVLDGILFGDSTDATMGLGAAPPQDVRGTLTIRPAVRAALSLAASVGGGLAVAAAVGGSLTIEPGD